MKYMIKIIVFASLIMNTLPCTATENTQNEIIKDIIVENLIGTESHSGNVIVGLGVSVALGIITGIASGTLSKATYEECQKRGYTKISKYLCWLSIPFARNSAICQTAKFASALKTPLNAGLAILIAQTVDWLIYFDKIKIPYYQENSKTIKKKTIKKYPLPATPEDAAEYPNAIFFETKSEPLATH